MINKYEDSEVTEEKFFDLEDTSWEVDTSWDVNTTPLWMLEVIRKLEGDEDD